MELSDIWITRRDKVGTLRQQSGEVFDTLYNGNK